MSNSRSWSTVVLAISMLTATAVATPQQSDADYARGQQAGYNACRTVCRPTAPIGNQASTSYGFGWTSGCTQAGGPTAACNQISNPGGGGYTNPPVNTTPQGVIDGYVGCMSGANLNRTLTVPDEFPDRVPYANDYYDGCLRALDEWQKKNPTKPVPVIHLPSKGKTSQENYERGRRVAAYACHRSQKLSFQVRTDVSGTDFARGYQEGCAAQPQIEQAEMLEVDANQSSQRATGLRIAAQKKADEVSPQKAQAYMQLSQLGADLNAEGKRLRDEASKLSQSPNPSQREVASLEARVRDYVQRVQDGEKKYYALNNASNTPVTPPQTTTQTPQQTTPTTQGEPPVTAEEAVAYIGAHPELAAKAQEIVRTMQAAHKSDKEIEVAIRRFVAESQAANSPSSGQQNARHTPQIPQMSNDELKQFIAENPELKKQMQDYADDLRRQGKSNDDVLLAVYQSLNEIHAKQVHEIAQAQTPQRFQSREVTRDSSASVGRYESRDIARTQAGEVQRQSSQGVQEYQSDGIQQQRAQDVQEYRGQKVQQYRAQDIQQDEAQSVQRYQAQDVKPYPAENPSNPRREIGPDPSRYPQKQSNNSAGSQFFHTFGLAVPGVVYSYDNYATNTRTTVTATGAVTKSAIRINPDHTYDWNSAWDGKMIHGRWTDWDGGIRLEHAQEGKDWLMHTLKPASGKATVVLYNDSTQYHGTPLD